MAGYGQDLEDLELVGRSLKYGWSPPSPEAASRFERTLERLVRPDNPPHIRLLAVQVRDKLNRTGLKAIENELKVRMGTQVGPQSWAAWLSEPEPEVSGNVTTTPELPYTDSTNGIQPPPACVIPLQTDVQAESFQADLADSDREYREYIRSQMGR